MNSNQWQLERKLVHIIPPRILMQSLAVVSAPLDVNQIYGKTLICALSVKLDNCLSGNVIFFLRIR